MAYREKINIYVPDKIGEILNNDATLFEIFKKDGIAINRNRFLSMLIVGYYNAYVVECRDKFEAICNEVRENGIEDPRCSAIAESILNKVVLPEIPKRKGRNPAKLSLKPTDDTAGIIDKVMTSPSNDFVSQYFCRMFTSYCGKSLSERERIIFKGNVDFLESACQSKRPILFSTIWNRSVIHEVVPYELVVGQDEMFNYLLCQEYDERAGRYVARAYRLNRITKLSYSAATVMLLDSTKAYLEQMKKYGAQYPINDSEEACVKLSEYGVISFNRIYHGRPRYEKIENKEDGNYYYFCCSKEQLFFYFRRFDADVAEIIYPSSLRERMIRFHTKSLEVYGTTEGDKN